MAGSAREHVEACAAAGEARGAEPAADPVVDAGEQLRERQRVGGQVEVRVRRPRGSGRAWTRECRSEPPIVTANVPDLADREVVVERRRRARRPARAAARRAARRRRRGRRGRASRSRPAAAGSGAPGARWRPAAAAAREADTIVGRCRGAGRLRPASAGCGAGSTSAAVSAGCGAGSSARWPAAALREGGRGGVEVREDPAALLWRRRNGRRGGLGLLAGGVGEPHLVGEAPGPALELRDRGRWSVRPCGRGLGARRASRSSFELGTGRGAHVWAGSARRGPPRCPLEVPPRGRARLLVGGARRTLGCEVDLQGVVPSRLGGELRGRRRARGSGAQDVVWCRAGGRRAARSAPSSR